MNQCGSSRGGGAAYEVESDHCRLAGVDFLGVMEANLWGRSTKQHKENERESKKGSKMESRGKNDQSCWYL